MKVFFYPHKYLRDRHLDTIRQWPAQDIINPELAQGRTGNQVSSSQALAKKRTFSLSKKIPLINLKKRPKEAPNDCVIYSWGGIILTGKYIIDLDNPWALTGYNLLAMKMYAWVIKSCLKSNRCIEIRCLSQACRESLKKLFGNDIYNKSIVHYPKLPISVETKNHSSKYNCRFLFIGTQFYIKGGDIAIQAYEDVQKECPNTSFDMITHLPNDWEEKTQSIKNLTVHKPKFSRQEIHEMFMKDRDVLILPTFIESFGMVVLEGIAHGMAIIATDVYAIKEMVIDDRNGKLIQPPIHYWNNNLPGPLFKNEKYANTIIQKCNKEEFQANLTRQMLALAKNKERLLNFQSESAKLYKENFQ